MLVNSFDSMGLIYMRTHINIKICIHTFIYKYTHIFSVNELKVDVPS